MSIPQVNTLSRKESRRLILVLTMMLQGASAYERKVAMQYHKDTIKIREAASVPALRLVIRRSTHDLR